MNGKAEWRRKFVLVVGDGIAGLALARALRQRGVPVARSGGTPRPGLAINLPGNAITALDRLGLRDEIESLGTPTRRREYRTSRGRLLFAVDEDEFWGPAARPRCVRRADLLDALADSVPAEHAPIASVRPVAGGAEVLDADGFRAEYGFLAGADGVRSTVRSALFPEALFPEAGTGRAVLSQASWRFMTPNPGVDCWTVWSGAGAAFLLIPVDNQVYGYASATGGGAVAADPSWLADTFAGYAEPVSSVVDAVLRSPSTLLHSPVDEVRAPSWSSGRCVLLGDAAHATAPVWAEGGALALEDALTLADLLATSDWDAVGPAFEAARRGRVAHVRAMTDRFAKTVGLPIWLRDVVTPWVGPRTYRSTYGPLRS
ncbi:FAD-dependent monooxygenase [Actinoplanes sp. NPDC051411]|uniref:FAD-dependent monooxygenase n=1 Tax=Actinoplanes sp. NPDC051411 TaxID=3155522 RepID=UPI0034200401